MPWQRMQRMVAMKLIAAPMRADAADDQAENAQ